MTNEQLDNLAARFKPATESTENAEKFSEAYVVLAAIDQAREANTLREKARYNSTWCPNHEDQAREAHLYNDECPICTLMNSEAKEERDTLRTENEKLREALRDAIILTEELNEFELESHEDCVVKMRVGIYRAVLKGETPQ